jgi:hypothetical protein
MDEKQHEKESKQFKEESAKYRAEMGSRDRATHSEHHSWEYDHKTGTLKDRRKK